MRVLVIGAGYIGWPLALELKKLGHEVTAIKRSPDPENKFSAAGISLITADVTKPETLKQIQFPFDWVVNVLSSSKGGVEEYRQVYLEGTRNLIRFFEKNPPKKYVYTSSTSVYGQTDGSAVKETHPTEPASETGKILVETEKLLLDSFQSARFPAIVLRVAGIYGPYRGHLFHQLLKNEAKIPGKGERIINMIHQDDVVGSIIAALKSGRPGEIYNVVDDEPLAMVHFFRWLSETLGKWMPDFVSEEEGGPKKRAVTNKKVQNRRLKMELGYQFKYPTFRQGYTAEIKRMEDAGEMNIVPDIR
jgi:nucleoside-diphosphate-sugar epimerase